MYIDVLYDYIPQNVNDIGEYGVSTVYVDSENPTDKEVSDEFFADCKPYSPDPESGHAWGFIVRDWKVVPTEEIEKREKFYADYIEDLM